MVKEFDEFKEYPDETEEFSEFKHQETIEDVINQINDIEYPYQLDEILFRIQGWENLDAKEASQYRVALVAAAKRINATKENDTPEQKEKKQQDLHEALFSIENTFAQSDDSHEDSDEEEVFEGEIPEDETVILKEQEANTVSTTPDTDIEEPVILEEQPKEDKADTKDRALLARYTFEEINNNLKKGSDFLSKNKLDKKVIDAVRKSAQKVSNNAKLNQDFLKSFKNDLQSTVPNKKDRDIILAMAKEAEEKAKIRLENERNTILESATPETQLNDNLTSVVDTDEPQADTPQPAQEAAEVTDEQEKEENKRKREAIEAKKEQERQKQQETASAAAAEEDLLDKRIKDIKRFITNKKGKITEENVSMLLNYIGDKKVNWKNASQEQKKIVAEAIKKTVEQYPNVSLLRFAYSSMTGSKVTKDTAELLETINKDFFAEAGNASEVDENVSVADELEAELKNVAETLEQTGNENNRQETEDNKDKNKEKEQQQQTQQAVDPMVEMHKRVIKRLFTETNGTFIANWLNSPEAKAVNLTDEQIKTLIDLTTKVPSTPGTDYGTAFYGLIPLDQFTKDQQEILKIISETQALVDRNSAKKVNNFKTCNSLEDYLLKDIAGNEILTRYAHTEEKLELQKITQEIFAERAAGTSTKPLPEMFKEKMEGRKIVTYDGKSIEFSPLVKTIVTEHMVYPKLEEQVQKSIDIRNKERLKQEKRELLNTATSGVDYFKKRLSIDTELQAELNLNKKQADTLSKIIQELEIERQDPLTVTQSFEDALIQKMNEALNMTPKGTMDTEYSDTFTPEQFKTLQRIAVLAEPIEERRINDARAKKELEDAERAYNEALETEYENLCDELLYSTRLSEYVASIDPMLDAESLKSSMALKQEFALDAEYDTCAKALNNPDWLIALQETFENDWMSLTDAPLPEDRKTSWQQFKETAKNLTSKETKETPLSDDAQAEKGRIQDDIDGIILARLSMLKPGDITLENAYAWLHLASGTSLESAVKSMVGKVLYEYDQEHFGSKTNDALAANYEAATKDLQTFISDPKNAHNILGDYYFTDEKDGPLTNKEERKIKESVLEVAAELVAEDFAKNPPLGSDEDKKVAMERALKDKVAMLTSGQKRLSRTEAIAGMAVHMSQAETFKNRIKTKFEGSTFYTNISSRLAKLDKKLTDRYGKKYTTAKKVSKFVAKTGWNVAKGMAMFAAANAVAPGVGPAVLIAYNTAKQWKSVKAQLTDPSISKGQKAAILIGTGVVSALSTVTAATGVLPALDRIGINTPEVLQNIGNAMSTITGRVARIGAITLGNTLPNMVKSYGISRKIKSLQKHIKAQSENLKAHPTSKEDLKLMQDLMKQAQELQKQKQKNKQEMIEKAASAALGGGLGTIFGPSIQNLIDGGVHAGAAAATNLADKVEVTVEEAVEEVKDSLTATTPITEQADSLTTQVADSVRVAQEFAATQEVADSTNTQQTLADKVAAAQRSEAGDTTRTSAPTQSSGETEIKDETKTGNDSKAETKTNETTGSKPAAASQDETQNDAQTVEQQHTKNFEAAKVEGTSGHGNLSAHQDTIRHLTNLGDSRFEDINATAQQLSEHLGDKTNMAVIACRMAPTDVYNALGFNGSDTPLTTHEMINYLANHDLTPEQQTNLNHVLQDKFGDWYSKAETHGVAPNSHTGSDNTQQTDTGKPAGDAAKTNTSSSTADKAGDAATKAAAASATTAATDKAAATTGGQTTGTEYHKMNVDPTGNKAVDALNAKYAVTNGLEGEAKSSIQFNTLSAEEAARLGLVQEQSAQGSQPQSAQGSQQPADQQPKTQEQQPSSKHATVEHRPTTDHNTSHTSHTTHDIPVEAAIPAVFGSAAWAEQNGYVYRADLSIPLNHGGMINHDGSIHHGYAAAYIKYDYQDINRSEVLFVTNDPLADARPEDVQTLATVKQWMHEKDSSRDFSNPYKHSNNPFGIVNVLHGSGHIGHAPTTLEKVMVGLAVTDAALHTVGHAAETIGHIKHVFRN